MLLQRHLCQHTQIIVIENGDTGEEEGSWLGGRVGGGGRLGGQGGGGELLG